MLLYGPSHLHPRFIHMVYITLYKNTGLRTFHTNDGVQNLEWKVMPPSTTTVSVLSITIRCVWSGMLARLYTHNTVKIRKKMLTDGFARKMSMQNVQLVNTIDSSLDISVSWLTWKSEWLNDGVVVTTTEQHHGLQFAWLRTAWCVSEIEKKHIYGPYEWDYDPASTNKALTKQWIYIQLIIHQTFILSNKLQKYLLSVIHVRLWRDELKYIVNW